MFRCFNYHIVKHCGHSGVMMICWLATSHPGPLFWPGPGRAPARVTDINTSLFTQGEEKLSQTIF